MVYFGNLWNWSPRPVILAFGSAFLYDDDRSRGFSLWCSAERILRGYSLWCSAERILRGWSAHLLRCSFSALTALFPNDIVFRLIRLHLFQGVTFLRR